MKSQRSGGHQLPGPEELMAILAHESPRQVIRNDYIETHPVTFGAFRYLADQAGSDVSWITGYSELSLAALDDAANATINAVCYFIQNHSDGSALYDDVYKHLVPADDLSPSELLFVHGAGSDTRVNKAIELYKQGVAPKILLSGNRPFYSHSGEPEAERMARLAVAAGVPENAVISEPDSITIPDNVKRSIDLLEALSWQPRSITVIATTYVLERARQEWYKFAPWDIAVKTVAAQIQDQKYALQNWYKDEFVARQVLNEYVKLVFEAKMASIK